MITTLASNDLGEVIPIVAIGTGGLIAVVAILFGSIRSMANTRAREESRREVAAYVAEGSMTPEDADRILSAGPREPSC